MRSWGPKAKAKEAPQRGLTSCKDVKGSSARVAKCRHIMHRAQNRKRDQNNKKQNPIYSQGAQTAHEAPELYIEPKLKTMHNYEVCPVAGHRQRSLPNRCQPQCYCDSMWKTWAKWRNAKQNYSSRASSTRDEKPFRIQKKRLPEVEGPPEPRCTTKRLKEQTTDASRSLTMPTVFNWHLQK